jgi:PAS domain S-box-containing protein
VASLSLDILGRHFAEHPLPMLVFDYATLEIVAVNNTAIEKYGYTRDEFFAMRITDIRPAEDVQRLVESLGDRENTWFHAGAWRHRLKSGQIIDVDITSYPVTVDGRKCRLVLAQDVTEKRRLEQQLRQAQKMEALGRLAGGVAHDFNNVLTAILGYSGLLLEDSSDPALRRGRIEQIHKAAQRARSLTTQLLAFSRKQIIEPRVIDLNAAVDDAARMLRRLVGDHIRTVVRLSRAPSRVRADSGEIVQLLTNLTINARDAMPAGGTLTIETSHLELDQAYASKHVGVAPGAYVMLAVSDTGIGMSPEVQERAFEPFFTTKASGKGTGLGLATVYGIVTQRGGHVWLYSEEGHGTTFKVYLPEVTEPVTGDVPAVERAPLRTATATVLVVEDDEEVRAVVDDALRSWGYEVLLTPTPHEARQLSRARTEPIDLLITDVVMPGETGPSLAQALMAARPELRVIYMSGFTDEVVVRAGTLRPDAVFLQKPFTLADLGKRIHELLGDARS